MVTSKKPSRATGSTSHGWNPARPSAATKETSICGSGVAGWKVQRCALGEGPSGPKTSLGELVSQLCHPVEWEGRRSRALNPYSPDDLALLESLRP
jgi:hypothetical protein